MAKGVTVSLEGLRELDAALGELGKATGKNVLRRAARAALEPIAEEARSLVPVDSGALRDSIVVSSRLANGQAKLRYSAAMFARQGRDAAVAAMRNELRANGRSTVEMFIGAGQLPHAHLIEFGSAKNAPRPYLRPAWDAGQNKLLGDLKEILGGEIEKAAARQARKAARLAAKG